MKDQETKERWVAARYIRPNDTVLDFTGKYEVSDRGRVRSLNYHRTGKTRVLSLCAAKANDGTIYHHVMLCLNNKKYMIQVHRLVLSSFKEGEHFPGAVCDHIDARTENSCCNHLDNLHWVTQQQNSSTERCIKLTSKALTNHPDLSKRVRVTNLTTGEATIYPSAREAGRTLGIHPDTPAVYINQLNGFYKKLKLRFEYIE